MPSNKPASRPECGHCESRLDCGRCDVFFDPSHESVTDPKTGLCKALRVKTKMLIVSSRMSAFAN